MYCYRCECLREREEKKDLKCKYIININIINGSNNIFEINHNN
jgi:hypothetical protein